MTHAWRALCFALVTLLVSATVLGQGSGHEQRRECPPETVRWTEACAARTKLSLVVRDCPDQRAVFMLRLKDQKTAVQIEVTARPQGFRTAHGFGISPVAQYNDWNEAPAELQTSFDRFVQCVEEDGTLRTGQPDTTSRPRWESHDVTPGITSPGREGIRTDAARGTSWPWRMALAVTGILALLGLWLRRTQRIEVKTTLTRTVLPLAALTVCTWALRRLCVDASYFHQNGQGPLWVDYALGLLSPYGAGMRETFGAVTSRASNPDTALFALQSLLAALGPASAWVIARRASARPLLAWAFALAVALDPVLARTAGSETYFATCTSLTLVAAAVLIGASARVRVRDPAFLLGALCAGLILSQSARIHPVAWVPAALVPLVLLPGPGQFRRRLVLTAAGLAVVGATLAVFTLPSMLATLHGELGQKWTGAASSPETTLPWHATFLLLRVIVPAALFLVMLARRRLRAAITSVLALVIVTVAAMTNKLGQLPAWYGLAYAWLHAPVVIACTAALLANLARSRMQLRTLTAATLTALALMDVVQFHALTAPATDQLEQALVRGWRSRLPDGSAVMFLGESGRRRLFLPLYTRSKGEHIYAQGMSAQEMTSGVVVPWQELFYYRSSLCSTPDGRPACETFEHAHTLEPMEARTLPARASMTGLEYDVTSVPVGLFRVVQ